MMTLGHRANSAATHATTCAIQRLYSRPVTHAQVHELLTIICHIW